MDDYELGFYLTTAQYYRFQNMVGYILRDHRQGLTPQVFEVFIIMKLNEFFCDENVVSEAYKSLRSSATD